MKRLLVIIITMFVLSVGCGSNGNPGSTFIAINWLYDPTTFSDNNGATPDPVTNGQYYTTMIGVYSYDYTAWDGSVWSGTYTIIANPGEKGDPFSDGTDGSPRFYDLYCYSIGPSFFKPSNNEAAAPSPVGTSGVITKTVSGMTMRVEFERMK